MDDNETPKIIYLQPGMGEEGETTWCWDRINEDDVTYVRLDVHMIDMRKQGAKTLEMMVERNAANHIIDEAAEVISDFLAIYEVDSPVTTGYIMDTVEKAKAVIAMLKEEELSGEDKSIEQPDGWISVDDRLPDTVSVPVLINGINDEGEQFMMAAHYDHRRQEWGAVGTGELDYCAVTHWRELPESPQEKSE